MEPAIVSCDCGAKLKLPPGIAAGKKIKCPKCSGIIVVPEESGEPLPAAPAYRPSMAAPSPSMKDCSYCGESILATAKKCKHCGEFLDEGAVASTVPRGKFAPASASAKESSDPNPAEYFAAIILAPVGLIIGGIWAAKKLPKAKKMLQVSGAMTLIYAVLPLVAWSVWNFMNPDGPAGAPTASNEALRRIPEYSVPEGFQRVQPPPRQGQGGGPTGGLPGGDIDLEGQPPVIQKAMKANVQIEIPNQSVGSGVIVQRDGDMVLILTNHHVVDMLFAHSQGVSETPMTNIAPLQITYYNKVSNPGSVVWIAPDAIDLAMIAAKAPKEIEPVVWQTMPKIIAGQDVFAVGNPVGLGWTFTKGVVSATRTTPHPKDTPKRQVPIIQHDSSITYGNSGGGLYSKEGELIGINSSIVNPLLGKAGFAIRATVLLDLKPTGLTLPSHPGSSGG